MRQTQCFTAAEIFTFVVLPLVLGCTLPEHSDTGRRAILYVANARADTISQLDAMTGRPIGPPLPAGRGPTEVVSAGADRLLVLSGGPAGDLTLFHRSGNTWQQRPLSLAPGARTYFVDAEPSGRYAVAVYATPLPASSGRWGPCRLALIDVRHGTVEQTHSLCAQHETVTDVAFGLTATGPVVYATLRNGSSEPPAIQASSRLVALRADTGDIAATFPVWSLVGPVVLANSPDGLVERLYVVVARAGAPVSEVNSSFWTQYNAAESWLLIGFETPSLLPISEHLLTFPVHELHIAPDGRYAYASGQDMNAVSQGTIIRVVDLLTGSTNLLGILPGQSLGLAVTDRWLYATSTQGSEIWKVDRHRGTLVERLPVGARPVAIAVGQG